MGLESAQMLVNTRTIVLLFMRRIYLLIPIVAAYLGLAFLAAHSVQPWCDEAVPAIRRGT